ncbi:MAG: oligosaccharide flippase family protein [Rhodospirillales bacterium]
MAASPRPALGRNYVFLTSGEVVSKVMAVASFMYLGRVLGPERYGNLEFTLAAMVFFTLPVDFGLADYGAREMARGCRSPADLLSQVPGLRLLLAFCSFSALLVFVSLLNRSAELKPLFLLYGLSLFGAPALLQWFFQGRDQMHLVAVISVVRQGVFTAMVFALVRSGLPLHRIGIAECASVLAAGVACVFILRGRLKVPLPPLTLRPSRLAGALSEALPIGFAQLAWAFQWYFATVLLGWLAPGEAVGWFGASHRVLTSLHTFVWLYFINLLPSISRTAAQPGPELRRLIARSLTISGWSAVFVAIVIAVFAPELLRLLYGAKFAGAERVLRLLVWMLPIAMAGGHYRYILIGYGRRWLLMKSMGTAATAAAVTAAVLIPRWGAQGAAAALLTAGVVECVLSYSFVRLSVVRPRGLE